MSKEIVKFRIELDEWTVAMANASGDGFASVSEMLRTWVHNYNQTGSPVGKGARPLVRVTAAEQAAVREALGGLDVVGVVVDAINKNRG
jgi:hypothetical protein